MKKLLPFMLIIISACNTGPTEVVRSDEELNLLLSVDVDVQALISLGSELSKGELIGRDYEAEFTTLRERIINKYPEVVPLMDDEACTLSDKPIDIDNSVTMGKQEDCKWLQYTACLLVATTAGPIFYWPAAFLCWCAFCDGNEQVCSI